MSATLLFVYGAEKSGFFNNRFSCGVHVEGEYVTRERFPLYLVGPRFVPWMVNARGEGEHVVGELYQVGRYELAQMDAAQRVGTPGGLQRIGLEVRLLDAADPQPVHCEAYLARRDQLELAYIRLGPLPEYTADHAALCEVSVG